MVALVAAPASFAATTPGITTHVENGGGSQWSPDSRLLAAIMNGQLIVIGDGRSESVKLASLLPGADASTLIALAGWQGSATLVVGPFELVDPFAAALSSGWTIDVSRSPMATAGTNLTFTATVRAKPAAVSQADLNRFAANAQVIYAYRTADGGADFYEVRPGPPSDGGAAPVLLVFVRGTTEAVRLPSLTDARDGGLVDAVLTG